VRRVTPTSGTLSVMVLPLARMALIVRPKRRLVDWVNGRGAIRPKLTMQPARPT
jgi:hypothetical protein